MLLIYMEETYMDKTFIENLLLEAAADPNLQLPDPDLILHYTNLKNRTIFINEQISDELMWIVNQIINWNREDKGKPISERKPIKIFFNSVGGDLDVEEILVSVIELSKTPVYGVALGLVASAASLIYLACHKRYAFKNAYWILHKGSAQISGDYNAMKAAMDDYEKQVSKMIDFYITHTGFTEKEIKQNINTDWYVRIEEALENNIATNLIEDIDVLF